MLSGTALGYKVKLTEYSPCISLGHGVHGKEAGVVECRTQHVDVARQVLHVFLQPLFTKEWPRKAIVAGAV